MTTFFVDDPDVALCERQDLGLLLAAQDLGASGRYPFQCRPGRFLRATHLVQPAVTTNAAGRPVLVVALWGAAGGQLVASMTEPLEPSLTGSNVAERVKQRLRRP